MFRAVGDWGVEKLTLLGALAWSLVAKLPRRFWWIVLDGRNAVTGVLGWLSAGFTGAGNRAGAGSRAGAPFVADLRSGRF